MAPGEVRPDATRSVLICSVPRSGSWLLAEALEETGQCGHPREYFRPDYERIYAREWALPPGYPYDAFVRAVRRAGSTPNGVFSAKLHWAQYAAARSRLRSLSPTAASDVEVLGTHFPAPTFVHLRREDTAAQAVSWYRAIRLDVWWRLDDTPPTRAGLPARVDLAEVGRLERTVVEHDRCWAGFFETAGVQPVPVTYEELVAGYPATVGRVLAAAGLRAVEAPPRPARLRKQADELSRLWTADYLRHREPG